MGAIDQLLSHATLKNLPVAGAFELTGRCNLSCKMCYIHQDNNHARIREEELSAAQWIDLAHQVQEAGTLPLLLTGGEPMLRPDFEEIFRACVQMGFVLTINTNGTLLRKEILDCFRKHPPFRVNLSLYGTSPETYERLCGNGAVYETVIQSIHALQELGINIKLNFTVTPYNQGDIAAMHAFAQSHKLPLHFSSYTFPPVRREEESSCTACRFSPQEAAQCNLDYVCTATPADQLQETCQRIAELPLPRADDCISDSDCSVRCRAGRGAYWITYRGDLLGCGMIPHIHSSVLGQSFTSAWEQLVAAYKQVLMPQGCVSCPEYERCEVCPAICYGENRNFREVPTYICEKNRYYREGLQQIGKGVLP